MALTPRQEQVRAFFEYYGEQNDGMSPTIQEVADHLGNSKTTAFEHMSALVEKGVLVRTGENRSSRGYVLASGGLVRRDLALRTVRTTFRDAPEGSSFDSVQQTIEDGLKALPTRG